MRKCHTTVIDELTGLYIRICILSLRGYMCHHFHTENLKVHVYRDIHFIWMPFYWCLNKVLSSKDHETTLILAELLWTALLFKFMEILFGQVSWNLTVIGNFQCSDWLIQWPYDENEELREFRLIYKTL